jgi:hypothetical protein
MGIVESLLTATDDSDVVRLDRDPRESGRGRWPHGRSHLGTPAAVPQLRLCPHDQRRDADGAINGLRGHFAMGQQFCRERLQV